MEPWREGSPIAKALFVIRPSWPMAVEGDTAMSAPGPAPIPSVVAGVTASPIILNGWVGKTIEDICHRYGKTGDTINHCAHFVSHVLQLRIPGAALCSNVNTDDKRFVYAERAQGYCVRVDEVFNSCNNRALYLEKEGGSFLMVATYASNITSKDPLTIGNAKTKHIGIVDSGYVYHFSNGQDKVVQQTVGEFAKHYGQKTILLRCDMP